MTSANEIRVTDWHDVSSRPEWQDSTVAAYRIWQEFDGRAWWQRHEWRMRDGSISTDEWIRGISGWAMGARPVAAAA